jgi:hypothetical protein
MFKNGTIVLLAILASACHSPIGPSYPVADCEYYDTGRLVLTNLSDRLTPRDVYVDGRFIDVVPYGGQIVLTVDAAVVHFVEWVSTLGGGTVDSLRVSVHQCDTYRLTNYF